MAIPEKVKKLMAGESVVSREPGNSMHPRIKHRQPVLLEPVANWQDVEVGDMVYCRVKGNYYTHLVKGKNDKRGLLISNLRGRVNGWTKAVFGKVVKVL